MDFDNKKITNNASHNNDEGKINIDNFLDTESSILESDFDENHKNNSLKEKKQHLLSEMQDLSKSMKDYEIRKKNQQNSLLLSNMINTETGEDELINYDLDEFDNLEDNSDGITKEELREKIFQFLPRTEEDSFQLNNRFDPKQINGNGTLKWYIKVSKWSVFFICLFNFLLLIIDIYVNKGNPIAVKFLSLYLWKLPFEFFVFFLLAIYISKKQSQLPRISGLACAFAGFESGVIIAIMKLFVYRDMWNIFNLSLEGIFLGVNGAVMGLIVSAIFFEIKK